MTYLKLIFEFFKTGLFSVGGGLATIPFLTAMTGRYDWFTRSQLTDMIAVAESTPGPIGVNTATFAGYNAAGVLGALAATAALVLPSFIVILLISRALHKYRRSRLVQSAFSGLRPAAAGLIAGACWSVTATALKGEAPFGAADRAVAALFAALVLLTNLPKLKRLHPALFIAIAAAAGVAFKM